jgi:hypothetical protein
VERFVDIHLHLKILLDIVMDPETVDADFLMVIFIPYSLASREWTSESCTS